MAFLILVIAPVDCFTCRTSAQDLELGVLADLLELLWGDVAVPPRQDGDGHPEPPHLVAKPFAQDLSGHPNFAFLARVLPYVYEIYCPPRRKGRGVLALGIQIQFQTQTNTLGNLIAIKKLFQYDYVTHAVPFTLQNLFRF